MVFQEGRRHLAMYNTPYGSMTIGVNTRHLHADLTERGGDIEIDYAIEIDHTVAGRNVFQINVREAGRPRRKSKVVDLDPKRFASGKTLPEDGLCPSEDFKLPRSPRRLSAVGGSTTPQLGGTCSRSYVREAGRPCRKSKWSISIPRFASGKTLPEDGLCPSEDFKLPRSPRRLSAVGGSTTPQPGGTCSRSMCGRRGDRVIKGRRFHPQSVFKVLFSPCSDWDKDGERCVERLCRIRSRRPAPRSRS